MKSIQNLALLLLAMLIFACQPDMGVDPIGGELTDNTRIVTDLAKSNLSSIDSSRLVFTKGDRELSKVKTGDILVSDMTTNAPDGFLRKVVSITENDQEFVYTTEQASLLDAVIHDEVRYSRRFTKDDIILLDTSGIDLTQRTSAEGIEITFDKVIYDIDNDRSTTFDQVKVKGSVTIDPNWHFEMKIEDQELQKLAISLDFITQESLELIVGGNLGSVKKDLVLATFQLPPISLPTLIPLPIAKQWLVLVLGAEGKLSAELSAGVKNNFTATIGVEYSKGGEWKDISDVSNNFSPPTFVFKGDAEAIGSLQFRHEIRPYGLKDFKMSLGLKGFVRAHAGFVVGSTNKLSYDLRGGLDFLAIIQMKLFEHTFAKYDKSFPIKKWPIDSGFLCLENPITGTWKTTSYLVESLSTWGLNDSTSLTISGDGINGLIRRNFILSSDSCPGTVLTAMHEGYTFKNFDLKITDCDSVKIYTTRELTTIDPPPELDPQTCLLVDGDPNNFTINKNFNGFWGYNDIAQTIKIQLAGGQLITFNILSSRPDYLKLEGLGLFELPDLGISKVIWELEKQ